MSFNIPTLNQIINNLQTDVKTQLPLSNPYLPNSYLLATLIGLSGQFEENYLFANRVFNALFLPTAPEDFLTQWGQLLGLPQLSSTASSGQVVFSGQINVLIPNSTQLTINDITYATQSPITTHTVDLQATFSSNGTLVTVVTNSPHSFATGLTVNMAANTIVAYNGAFVVNVLDDTTFTYTIDQSITNTDFGSVNAIVAKTLIQSLSSGINTNQTSGANLILVNQIVGLDNTAFVDINGLTGGNDQETADDYRDRLLFKLQNNASNESISGIVSRVKTVNGITRVWVNDATPSPGSYEVYFVRDNDNPIFPSPTQLQEVKNLLTAIDYKSAEISTNDIYVLAPTPKFISFVFQSLTPDTTTMRDAITKNLQLFFEDVVPSNTTLKGFTIVEAAYQSVIFNTIDPQTGQKVTSYTLTSPIGDIVLEKGEIPILSGPVTL